jgi:hypothetical protein
MRLPATRGNFPAFWLHNADGADMGALDIVESFGRPRRPATWCKPSAPGSPVQVVSPGDEPRTGLLSNVHWSHDPSGIKRCLGVGELRRLGIPQYR